MQNLKIDTRLGSNFSQVAQIAKDTATETQNAEFDFNGVKCIVSRDTNLDALIRDYTNSWTMEWKTVGPDCVAEYSPETAKELKNRQIAAEEKAEKEREALRKQDREEKQAFEKKVSGVVIEWKDIEAYKAQKDKNSDPYGSGIMEYAEGWAKLMQSEISQGKTVSDCAERTSFEMGFMGITGFMYGAAVMTLATHWKHGEELKKWHNSKYNHKGDGVVNPAVLTIGK